MKRFILLVVSAILIPLCWTVCSFLIQRFLHNPIGNPEAKYQLQNVNEADLVFIGPSVFHQRINEELIEEELDVEVCLITSIGQSTLANLVLTRMVAEKAPTARIFLAGHDREIQGKGLHQCWTCSDLPFEVIRSEWSEVSSCFWYDIFLGLLAELIPAEVPLGYAKTDSQMIRDGGWAESNKRYLENADEIMRSMDVKLVNAPEIPRKHLYSRLADSCEFELIAPPNGSFCKCPEIASFRCHQSLDSTWIRKELWIDGGHISPSGARKFTQWLIELVANTQEISSEAKPPSKLMLP